MNVDSIMQTNIVSVHEDDSMTLGLKKIRENKIKHLTVLDSQGVLAGIVTDRDLKRASASDATTLEIHELLYLLDKVKMKESDDKKSGNGRTGYHRRSGRRSHGRTWRGLPARGT